LKAARFTKWIERLNINYRHLFRISIAAWPVSVIEATWRRPDHPSHVKLAYAGTGRKIRESTD